MLLAEICSDIYYGLMKHPRRSRIPRYQQLRETLLNELAEGRYPVGSKFPTEYELCERYRVGRHTVREALRGLQEAGMLSRHAGSGSVVTALTPPDDYVYRIDSIDNLTNYAHRAQLHVKQENVIVIHEQLAQDLGVAVGSRWLRVAGLRQSTHDEFPIAWTDVFIAEPYIGIRSEIGQVVHAIYQKLSEQYGLNIAEVERNISANAMPTAYAMALNCAPGSPALVERRSYWSDAGELFEISVSFYVGSRFSQSIRLKRST